MSSGIHDQTYEIRQESTSPLRYNSRDRVRNSQAISSFQQNTVTNGSYAIDSKLSYSNTHMVNDSQQH